MIKVQFTREDGTIAIIYKKAPKTEDESSNAPKVEQPKAAPKAEAKPQPKVEPKQEQPKPVQPKPVQPVKANEPVNKKPATKKVVGKPLTYDDIIRQIWPQLDNPQPIVKEQPKAEPAKEEAKPLNKVDARKARKAERKENRPQKVVKSKLSRKGFRK